MNLSVILFTELEIYTCVHILTTLASSVFFFL